MEGMQIRVFQMVRKRAYAGLTVLAMLVTVLAGCASNEKVKPVDTLESFGNNEPSIARLDDGRDGFIIREAPRMDETSRRNFDRAVGMLKDQDFDHAIELLEKVIEQSPGVTAPYIDIAIAYQGIGKLEQAEEHLKTALQLFPDHPVVCNEYGLLYRKTGRFVEAKAVYEKALARFPEYHPVHRNLGILCDLYLNDLACALEHYEIYSEAMPDDKQVKLWIADLSARLGRD